MAKLNHQTQVICCIPSELGDTHLFFQSIAPYMTISLLSRLNNHVCYNWSAHEKDTYHKGDHANTEAHRGHFELAHMSSSLV